MKILILRESYPNSIDDIRYATDYEKWEKIKGYNTGNKLWITGLVSSISTPDNEIHFITSDMTTDFINDYFDLIIAPEANIFSERFSDLLVSKAKWYQKLKIPIYVIACGAAALTYDDLDKLCVAIKDSSKQYIESVYSTGGEFALRGEFSKCMFDKLGYHSAVVTGCPSLYQMGRDFQVKTDKVDKNQFKPALNGNLNLCNKALHDYANSEYFDQSFFYDLFYRQYSGHARGFINAYGTYSLELFKEKRINLIIDMQDWMNYFLYHRFNFSAGSRIHGTVMPILCGIQSVICPPDTRVREMAEFFEIPTFSEQDLLNDSLYDIYLSVGYEKFNAKYKENFARYEKFLIDHKIVKNINEESILKAGTTFIDKDRMAYIDRYKDKALSSDYFNKLLKSKSLWVLYEAGRNTAKKIKRKL